MDPSTRPSFRFVNLKHHDDLGNEEVRRRIRRIVMADVGKARRKPKSKRERNEIVLEIRDPNLLRVERLGGGQVDPFCRYPVEVTDAVRELVTNILDPASNHPIRLRDHWYPVGLSCAAVFHNVLSNSQNFRFQKWNGAFPSRDDDLALTHSYKALRAASEMMQDSKKHVSDEMIGTVASFMCHHSLLKSFADGHWCKHRNALVHIVELRGGYEAIENEHLRITLTWSDLVGCFSQDIPPIIPLPTQWDDYCRPLPSAPRPHRPISLLWKKQLPMQLEWISIFDDIVQLVSLDPAFNQEQTRFSGTESRWMEPIAYRLLCVRSLQQGHERGDVMEEVCRLGTLLFLTPLWRLLGRYTIWTAILSRKLLLRLTEDMVEWNELKPLLVWVLYFAAIETKDFVERSHFVFMLAVLMKGMNLREWDQAMHVIKGVLWVGKVYTGSDEMIRDEVMQMVNHDYIGNTITVPHFANMMGSGTDGA